MAKKETPAGPVLGLQVTTDREYHGSVTTLRLCIFPVLVDRDKETVEGLLYDEHGKDTRQHLADFQINYSGWSEGGGWYEYEFRRPYSINEARCESMLKVLKTVRKSLESQEKDYGRHESFGAYVLRICKALGAEWVLTEPYRTWEGNEARPNDEGRFLWGTPVEAMPRINQRIDHWKEHMSKAAPAA